MIWKNIKNFMIILLAAVNIFLAVMLVNRTAVKVYDPSALKNITELLSSGGIIADEKFLNTTGENIKIYVCDLEADYTASIAKMLMGEYEEVFSTPSGTEFFGKDSRLKIDSDLNINFSYNGFEEKSEFDALTSAELKSLRERISNLLGDSIHLITSGKNGDYIFAEVIQSVGGLNVENHSVKCAFDADRLVFLDGMWCFASIDESFSAHTLDSVNILFIEKSELAAEREENPGLPAVLTVSNMSHCYCSHLSVDGTKIYFMPSWHIEWQEKELNDTFYNAVNGEKTVIDK